MSTDPTTNLLGRTRPQTIRPLARRVHAGRDGAVPSGRPPRSRPDRSRRHRPHRRSRPRPGRGCPRHPGRAGSPRPGGRWRSRTRQRRHVARGAVRAIQLAGDRIELEEAEPPDRRVTGVGEPDREPRAGLVPADVEFGERSLVDDRRGRPVGGHAGAVGEAAQDERALVRDRRRCRRGRSSRSRPRSPPSDRSGRRPGATRRRRWPSRCRSPDRGRTTRAVTSPSAARGDAAAEEPVAGPRREDAGVVVGDRVRPLVADAPDVDVRARPSRPTGGRVNANQRTVRRVGGRLADDLDAAR